MAFLRAAAPEDYLEPLFGDGLVLRPPVAAHYAEWAELRALSRQHLTPWEPAWSSDDLTKPVFRRRLRAYGRDVRDGLGYSYFVTESSPQRLVGGIALTNVRRGSSQAATLGYWTGAPFTGRGYMTNAVARILDFAFLELHLHRVEAASMPANAASIRVLEKNGFENEGLARSYLKINGRWEDHLLFARIGAQAPRRSGAAP